MDTIITTLFTVSRPKIGGPMPKSDLYQNPGTISRREFTLATAQALALGAVTTALPASVQEPAPPSLPPPVPPLGYLRRPCGYGGEARKDLKDENDLKDRAPKLARYRLHHQNGMALLILIASPRRTSSATQRLPSLRSFSSFRSFPLLRYHLPIRPTTP